MVRITKLSRFLLISTFVSLLIATVVFAANPVELVIKFLDDMITRLAAGGATGIEEARVIFVIKGLLGLGVGAFVFSLLTIIDKMLLKGANVITPVIRFLVGFVAGALSVILMPAGVAIAIVLSFSSFLGVILIVLLNGLLIWPLATFPASGKNVKTTSAIKFLLCLAGGLANGLAWYTISQLGNINVAKLTFLGSATKTLKLGNLNLEFLFIIFLVIYTVVGAYNGYVLGTPRTKDGGFLSSHFGKVGRYLSDKAGKAWDTHAEPKVDDLVSMTAEQRAARDKANKKEKKKTKRNANEATAKVEAKEKKAWDNFRHDFSTEKKRFLSEYISDKDEMLALNALPGEIATFQVHFREIHGQGTAKDLAKSDFEGMVNAIGGSADHVVHGMRQIKRNTFRENRAVRRVIRDVENLRRQNFIGSNSDAEIRDINALHANVIRLNGELENQFKIIENALGERSPFVKWIHGILGDAPDPFPGNAIVEPILVKDEADLTAPELKALRLHKRITDVLESADRGLEEGEVAVKEAVKLEKQVIEDLQGIQALYEQFYQGLDTEHRTAFQRGVFTPREEGSSRR
ncbi:hypothetical protein HOC01_06410 [archaeon]|jgi:hypothetical protein|nr:hypothetical protein [archaeon]MBT6697527.1 hypothetical protein [archaeon]